MKKHRKHSSTAGELLRKLRKPLAPPVKVESDRRARLATRAQRRELREQNGSSLPSNKL